MQIEKTALAGVVLIVPPKFGDARGWFSETWNAAKMAESGIEIDFVQDNHSFSAQIGTLRGLHYQRPPHAQDKLVRCTRGVIFDVAVDIRKGSPTYGQWVGADLSAANGHQLLIPKGFLHGFVTRTPDCEVQYKCSDFYAPDCDGGIRWDDPTIGIDWGLGDLQPTLSAKDTVAPMLADFDSPFKWEA
ncbi:dTDP-4-dehydrorhamnose 3,5-epimerase [Ketogulonicigenium robustum]|uniref:dTDP-4-dehydrorhamnose 3,5-epimerase n=1 Tax=Ketogulonicigenium robustum TaxID=92947 RepID=A0A1W6NZ50_9RHOB|nr:dTDP-4-dehydrorhamnose 3,5-epimerase [Ketogulonicigenium robustum]ARO14469.1 dTDP-4-dehydrorhamnose 3,5-epimerase [Ketogulonicigenium robustum]